MRELVAAGMDVARLNFSHGEHAEHQQRYHWVREAAAAAERPVGILADLQGPKIRLGRFADGPVLWANGETVVITSDEVVGTHDRVSCTYRSCPKRCASATGCSSTTARWRSRWSGSTGRDITCLVTEGGQVSNNKGVSLPNVAVSVPALSEKDAADLRFALSLGVDMIALSFVRSPDDIKLVHEIMDEVGRRVPVIAKIEKPEAVARLEAIVNAFDGLMVARGDLGVELPLEQVPLVQKRAVQLCREQAKPVIVATQMLDSMIENARPTRAEASDVANAVLDGADAVMLSGETSVGQVSDRHGADDGPHHPHHRGRRHRGAAAAATTRGPAVARSPRPRRTSPARSTPVRWSRSARPVTRYGGWPGCTASCRCWRSPRSRRCRTS